MAEENVVDDHADRGLHVVVAAGLADAAQETPVRRAFGVVAVRPGARWVRSARVNTRSRSSTSPLRTEIGIGTSFSRSDRLRAVTTISPMPPAAATTAPSAAAVSSCACNPAASKPPEIATAT